MRLCLLLLSLFVCSAAFAAPLTPADSLQAELKKAGTNPQKRSDILSELCFVYKSINGVQALAYGRESIDLAKKGGVKPELAKAYIYMGYACEATGKVGDGFKFVDSAGPYMNAVGYRMAYYRANLRGNLYRRKGVFDEALKYFLKAQQIAEENKDLSLEGKALNALGTFNASINDVEKAEQYHLKALEIRKKLGGNKELYQTYDNLGILYRMVGEYDEALNFYAKAMPYAIQGGDSSNLAYLYNDMGAAYSYKGDLEKADHYLRLSIGIRERLKEMNELSYTYNYLGENYERSGNLDSAEAYIRKAVTHSTRIGNTKQNYEAFESLSDLFARHNRFDSAYKYIELHRHLKDSVRKANQEEIIAELNTKFETEKKEHQITEQEFQITRRNYWIAGILFVLIAGALLVLSASRRNKLKQKASLQQAIFRQQELATKAVIEAEEKERKRIAGDLHDGVGQMMSAAKINLSTLFNEVPFENEDQKLAYEKALSLVDESCKEVRTVSHNIMPNALLKSGLASAVREFLNKIDHRVMNVNLYTEGLNERIDTNIETVLYRVVQECVNNVIKHSGGSQLDITLLKDEEGISVTIEDNGKGFDPKAKAEGEGIGLKNIMSRVAYLKGTVEWDSAPGKGTVVTLHIPVGS